MTRDLTQARSAYVASPPAKAMVSATLITILVCAVFIGGTHPGIMETGVRMMSGLLAIGVLLGWAVLAISRSAARPTSVVLGPVVIAFLLFCMSAAVSQVPRMSQDAILQTSGLLLAFLLLSRLASDPFFRSRLIGIVATITIVVVVSYAAYVLIAWAAWWSSIGRLTAPPLRPAAGPEIYSPILGAALTWLNLGAVNLTAGICLLAAPFAVAVVAGRSRAAALVLAAMAVFVLVASGSRGGVLGGMFAMAAAVLLTAIALGPAVTRRAGEHRRGSGRRRIAAIALVIVAAAVLLVALAPALIARFAVGIDSARLSLYQATIPLIEAHPLLGNGPGTWPLLHLGTTPEGATSVVQNHAHDTYLQTLAEVGIVGGTACLVVVLVIIRRLFLRFLGAEPRDRMVIGAILVGLAGAAGHAISDHFLNLAGYSLILASLVAIGLERPRIHAYPNTADEGRDLGAASRVAGRFGLAVLVGACVTALLIAPTVITHARAELLAEDARLAADRGDWESAAASSRQAATLDPDLPIYRIELALALAHLGDPAARPILTKAATEDPLAHLQLSVAALALADGDLDGALAAVQTAERRSSAEVVIGLNAGEVARLTGHPELATEWWASAMTQNVAITGSKFFSDPSRADLALAAAQQADAALRAQDNDVARALLLAYRGSPADAEVDLRRLPRSTRRDVALAQVLRMLGRQRESIEVLEAAADDDLVAPSPPRLLVDYCSEINDRRCVDRYLARALILLGGVNASAPNDGSTIPAPPNQRSRGKPEAYPGSVYLRPGFDDMQAPGVLVVGLP